MDKRYQVIHYIAVVRGDNGQRFTVFETGDPQYWLFCPMIGETTMFESSQFPVEKKRLRKEIRSMLANGCGNSY